MVPFQQNPKVMGVINVTPDSFSGGRRLLSVADAVDHASSLVRDGADILDVGGESSRPGALPVTAAEEASRVVPVVEALCSRFDLPVSVDTRRFEVGVEAVKAGATIINDIEGGRDPRWCQLESKAVTFILMHMQGTPQTMQVQPQYPEGVVAGVKAFLKDRVEAFERAGIGRDRVWIDPGIGFGKTADHCLTLLHHISELCSLGVRVVVGTSRKSFLARVLGLDADDFDSRLPGGIASDLWALSKGASVFRVHDVLSTKRAIAAWRSIYDAC